MNKTAFLRKYFIMGSQNCLNNPETILREAIAGGITAFQFREKGTGALTGEAKISLGKRLRKICKENQIPFIVNDDIELASLLNADGIHVGQDDLSVEKIRKKHPNIIIGLSISNERELQNSDLSLVDYVGAGPVFATATKEDAKQAVGIEWIQTLRNRYSTLRIVGIGGINEHNAQKVMDAGANGVAFITAVTHATDIQKVLKCL